MTSYLFISTDSTALEKALDALCQEKHVNPFDKTVFDLATAESKAGTKKSWGIDDIKMMLKKICLKPLRGEWKAIIIKDAELLTTYAQNALLKTLEEPPDNTLLFLTAASSEPFLPTILSRCTIKILSGQKILSVEMKEQTLTELKSIVNASVGERLKRAETLSKNKEEVLSFIRYSLLSLHERLSDDSSSDTVQLLRLLHEHYKVLKNSNTNVRITTEHLLLSFPMS